MEKFFTDFYTAYGTTDFASSLTGGLHFGRAPQDTSYPFGVYFSTSVTPAFEETFTADIEDLYLQINIYSDSSSPLEATQLLDDCIESFDGLKVTVTDTADAVMKRALILPPIRATYDDRDLWQATAEFSIKYQRNAIHH
jgi:hypothetical protein